ncbi:hypothetical protein NBH00_16655 [Paraconexibacter antarcticus]|uniref:Acyltransferase n=1 Tax=Paraconexibacter antarcticus TaxID=2949664 RepID=A0ABY5DPZ8_9ACTN|nr:hypothetical protein [Paraconexibacter antarcticus]UTI62984.1 hypothetical protein NBH00_16655 [Paraconexibacter antarcticus]
MPAAPPPPAAPSVPSVTGAAPEPRLVAAPPAGPPPSGLRALLRARLLVLRHRGRVRAARGAAVGPGVVVHVAPGALLLLGPGCAIGDGTRLHVAAGELRIGRGTVLGERCVARLLAGADVGPQCRLADEVVLADCGPVTSDVETPLRRQGLRAAPIAVGAGVRIGPRAVVLGGARIAAGVQVGAQLVVRGDVAADSPDLPARPDAAPH